MCNDDYNCAPPPPPLVKNKSVIRCEREHCIFNDNNKCCKLYSIYMDCNGVCKMYSTDNLSGKPGVYIKYD